MCLVFGPSQATTYFNSCRDGDYKVFTEMHEKFAQDFDARYPRGRVPKKFLQHAKIQERAGISALVLAIIGNRVDIVQELISQWGNAVTYSETILELSPDNSYLRYLHCHQLLDHGEEGENVVIIPPFSSPLMFAIILERDEIVRRLLRSLNYAAGMRNRENYTALDYLIMSKRNQLLDIAVDTNSKFLNIELCKSTEYVKCAVKAGNYKVFEYFFVVCRQSAEFCDTFGSLFAISRPEQLIIQLLAATKTFLREKQQSRMLTQQREAELATWTRNLTKTQEAVQQICQLLSNVQMQESTARVVSNKSVLDLGVLRHCGSVITHPNFSVASIASHTSSTSKLKQKENATAEIDE